MLALTYCISLLGGGNILKRIRKSPKLGPCWHYVGTFFALWRFFSFLRASYALLARFSVVLGVFFTSWDAPNSILEGPGRLRGRFSRPRGLIFPGFFVHASLQPLALNQTCACVKNHSFSYVFLRCEAHRACCTPTKKR